MRAIRSCVFPALSLGLLAAAANAQTAQLLSHSLITPTPPDSIQYEKAIGNFTSTEHPSYFLGTDSNSYIFDTETGQSCSLNVPGKYYEGARPYTHPGDKYAGVVASLYTSTVWLENPMNWGGDVCGGWPVQVIDPNRGAHALRMADLDGDGKLDVIASGQQYPEVIPQGFLRFQNNYDSWVAGAFNPPMGDSVDLIRVDGVNSEARTNFVACNPTDNSLYWYQNPGGDAARNAAWTPHLIARSSTEGQPACTQGIALASVNVGDRDIVVVASSETGQGNDEGWSAGLGYFDPGTNPGGEWTFHQIDSSALDVHQIESDVLNGVPFFTIGEQEQATASCNQLGYDDHKGSFNGCRVAVYAWNGNGFSQPTILSTQGSHNQALYQLDGVEYMAGSNHNTYGAVDNAYNLWTFTLASGPSSAALAPGTYFIADESSGNRMDLGWAVHTEWGFDSLVALYEANTSPDQRITLTPSGQLEAAATPGMFLHNRNGSLALGTAGDVFVVARIGSGYTIQDVTAGGIYVNSANEIGPYRPLTLSATPTVWNINPR